MITIHQITLGSDLYVHIKRCNSIFIVLNTFIYLLLYVLSGYRDGEYNDLASIFFNTMTSSMEGLFHTKHASFSWQSVAIAGWIYYFMSIVTVSRQAAKYTSLILLISLILTMCPLTTRFSIPSILTLFRLVWIMDILRYAH